MKFFLALGTVAAIALPVNAVPIDPDLNCYMVNAQGTVMNLRDLCSGTEPGRIIRTGNVPGVLNPTESVSSSNGSFAGSSGGSNISPSSSDLDCADVGSNIPVAGSDPNGFDGDGDGIGCES